MPDLLPWAKRDLLSFRSRVDHLSSTLCLLSLSAGSIAALVIGAFGIPDRRSERGSLLRVSRIGVKMSSLQRETFKNLAVKEKLKTYGNWLKAKAFRDHFDGVQIRDDKETMGLVTSIVEEIYGEAKVSIP